MWGGVGGRGGCSGGKGVDIIDVGGKQEYKYVWGTCTMTNNEAESLAIFQGLKLLSQCMENKIPIIGDSSLIVNTPSNKEDMSSSPISRNINQAKTVIKKFRTAAFIHVL